MQQSNYTKGSTGKPKGLIHTTGGYLLYASVTHKYVFDYRPGDIHACVADIGFVASIALFDCKLALNKKTTMIVRWITGHSYIVYGPLLNGATTIMFEGLPTHPTPSRYWELIEKVTCRSVVLNCAVFALVLSSI